MGKERGGRGDKKPQKRNIFFSVSWLLSCNCLVLVSLSWPFNDWLETLGVYVLYDKGKDQLHGNECNMPGPNSVTQHCVLCVFLLAMNMVIYLLSKVNEGLPDAPCERQARVLCSYQSHHPWCGWRVDFSCPRPPLCDCWVGFWPLVGAWALLSLYLGPTRAPIRCLQPYNGKRLLIKYK